jgi:DNA polymerase-3 subunit delta'
MAAQGQGDLLVLERGLNDKGKLRQDIAVDDVRKTVSFFGSTAWEGGWRIAIVDSVDELNPSGENALLKVLEEPPPRSLLLLVSHSPGRVLPTIRSRCRMLALRPLDASGVAMAASAVLGQPVGDSDVRKAADAAEGSVARALALLDGSALALRQRVLDTLSALPHVTGNQLHGLGDALAGTDAEKLSVLVETVNGWLSAQLDAHPNDPARLARVAEVWDKFNNAAREAEAYNLERKPLVFAVFGLLADAARP